MINSWLTAMPKIGEIYINFKNIVLGLIVICIFLEIILSKYSIKFLFLTLILLGLAIFLYYNSNILWSFYLIYFICFSRNIKLKEYLLLIKKVLLFIFCVNVSIFFIQYILSPESLDVVTSRGLLRYYLYFDSPNGAGKALVCLVLIYFMCSNQKLTINKKIVFSLLSIIFYYFTNSAFIFSVLLIFLFDSLQENQIFKVFIAKITKWCIPLCAILSFFSVYFYPNYLTLIFDKITTGRISLSQKSLEYYGITLFGQYVDIPRWALLSDGSYQLLTCDNTYIYTMICSGSILLLLLIIFNFYFVKNLDYKINVAVLFFSILSLVYFDAFSPLCSFPLIAVAISKYDNSQKTIIQTNPTN